MSIEDLKGKILLDTNVLIYATLAGDARHARAKEVLDLRNKDGIEVFISVQNLAEMYPNLTGPRNQPPDSPELARAKIRSIAALPGITVLPVTFETVTRALALCAAYSRTRQDYFDMQLVGTMQQEGVGTILTENADDFAMVEGISVHNPFV